MSVGVFTDKKVQPSEAEVRTAIGPMAPAWDGLVAYLRETYAPDEGFAYLYGKRYGWALRLRIRKQLLTNLYPAEGGFKAQINLPPEAVEMALTMDLGASARQAIEAAYPYPEGRWAFMPVTSDEDVVDVKRLLALRVEAKHLNHGRAR